MVLDARVRFLMRASRAAVARGAAHLQRASHAREGSPERVASVAEARRELAIVTARDEEALALLDPTTGAAEELRRKLALCGRVQDEFDPPR